LENSDSLLRDISEAGDEFDRVIGKLPESSELSAEEKRLFQDGDTTQEEINHFLNELSKEKDDIDIEEEFPDLESVNIGPSDDSDEDSDDLP